MRGFVPFFAAVLLACATSPLGRSQLRIFPDTEMTAMGATAYRKLKDDLPVDTDRRTHRYVSCVADALIAAIESRDRYLDWEVTVFQEPTPNAFALPGGKIGVHTGLLGVARNKDQVATVLGHEVAHVLADHGNERVSTAFATQSGLQMVRILSGSASPAQQQVLSLLGAGAQVGVLLPFSRTQEREADLLGIDLMARAGFDPRESVTLWENMAKAGGAQPPEFLSTHPSHGSRIKDLNFQIPRATRLRHQSGSQPKCK